MESVEIPSTPLKEMALAKLGVHSSFLKLQNAIDYLVRKAQSHQSFTVDEKTFLVELFECFSLGGRAMWYPEAAQLVRH